MSHDFLLEVIVLLSMSVVMVAVFRRLMMPAVLAYLCVGALVGPHGLGWIPSTEDTHLIAEFGIVFLLFIIGLEFSLSQLLAMRTTVFALGGAQVILSTALFGFVAWLLGVAPLPAFIIGGILALSSTAIVSKQLVEQMELQSHHGRRTLGVLLFQDLAVVPFLVIIPILATQGNSGMLQPLLLALLKAALIFVLMLAVGRWLLRPLLHEVASAKSSEFFTLAVLLISLGAAWATDAFGLSLALGGFLAGMMIAETEYRHQVESDIRPFQDILLGLFFITVGMLFDPATLGALWPYILLATLGVIIGKALIVILVMRLAGDVSSSAIRTGLLLAQGGEFGFALLALASDGRLLSHSANQIILSTVLLSMTIAPLLIRHNARITEKLFAVTHRVDQLLTEERIAMQALTLDQHVIICGYGRVGQNLARLLDEQGMAYLAVDMDPVRIKEATMAGDTVHFGDPTKRRILEAAGLRNARLLVISFNHFNGAMKILEHVRNIHPDLTVLVRTGDDSEIERLFAAGATEVIPETVEASLMMGAYMMQLLGMPTAKILRIVQDVRSARYKMFRAYFHGEQLESSPDSDHARERLHSVTLPPHARAIEHTLEELALEQIGVSVTAVRRGSIRGPDPGPETRLCEGDVLVLYGAPDSLKQAEELLLRG